MRKRASPRDRRCTAFMLLRQASYGKKERLVGDMLDKETYYLKKMKLLMLQIFNMVMKTEETALKETASSHNISVSEMHTLVAVGRGEPKTMSTVAGELLINVSTLSIAINKLEKKRIRRAHKDRSRQTRSTYSADVKRQKSTGAA